MLAPPTAAAVLEESQPQDEASKLAVQEGQQNEGSTRAWS